MNKIILTADCEIEDKELRTWFGQLQTKIETLNDRTKAHTIEIKELKKELKKLKEKR